MGKIDENAGYILFLIVTLGLLAYMLYRVFLR